MSNRIVPFSSVLLIVALCLAWEPGHAAPPEPVAIFESRVFGEGRTVDLSGKMRKCSEEYVLGVGDTGRIVVHYPRSVEPRVAEAVASDYVPFFAVALDTIGKPGFAVLHTYLVPLDSMPSVYRFREKRVGAEWQRVWLAPLILVGGTRGGYDYWHQVSRDVHELAHGYWDSTWMSCQGNNPLLRWLDEGVPNLVAARYLRAANPAAYDTWVKNLDDTARKHAPSLNDVLEWRVWDRSHSNSTKQELQKEAGRYARAFQIVRDIYNLDEGVTLRAFMRELEQHALTQSEFELRNSVATVLERAAIHQ